MNATADAASATGVPRLAARAGAGLALALAAAAVALAPAASATTPSTIPASGTSCPQQGTLAACQHTGDYQGDFSRPVTAPSATEFPYEYLGGL